MLKANWMALLATGLLLPAAASADDAKPTDSEPLPMLTPSGAALLAELEYASRWHLFPETEAIAYSGDWPRQLNKFDVRLHHTNTLMRVSRSRSLSFLTVAKFRRAQLFFGVNDDGVVGLHFNAFRRNSDERHLEMFRMPYVKDTRPASELSQPGSEEQ